MKIAYQPNERALAVGKTKSGKSFFILNALVPFFKYYVVYDYKHEINLPGAVVFNRTSDFQKRPGQAKIIYRPAAGDDAEFNELCRIIYFQGNRVFVVDEIANHCTQSRIQPYHGLIMRLGRTRGIGIINCAQEPVGIHRNLMTQAEHFFIFDIPDSSHRDKLAGYTGPQVRERVQNHYFWYYAAGMSDPVLMSPLKK